MRLPTRAYMDRVLKQAYDQYNDIHFIPYISRPSNLYGETIGKSYGDPIKLRGYLEMDPTELKLQDLGWSRDTAEILVRFPFVSLLGTGLVEESGEINISVDYKILIPTTGKEFQVSKIQGREPFINGQPTFVWVGGKKFTHGR